MKLFPALALSPCLASPAVAGVDALLDDHILPGLATFAATTGELMAPSSEPCLARMSAASRQWAADILQATGRVDLSRSGQQAQLHSRGRTARRTTTSSRFDGAAAGAACRPLRNQRSPSRWSHADWPVLD